MEQTIEDAASIRGAGGAAVPAIVLIATGTQPATLVLPPRAELGRRIAAGEHVHEIADDRMSKDHARVAWERGGWLIEDLESRNGTFVDGEQITGEVRRPGDAILRLGHTVFVLLADGRGHPAPEPHAIVGPELARAHGQIRVHAGAETLLLHAESATGKQHAARLYHEAGPRRDGPFIAVNCATIPEGVAARLLFGSTRRERPGGVSGAIKALGYVQQAQGGTLFLDEIAELEPAVQGKLLRLIERLSDAPLDPLLGLGIVAADDDDLEVAVAEGRFRGELYERLARAAVEVPALRERKVDLARIVQYEVEAGGLAPHAKLVEACCVRPWPGNLRELRDAIRHAVAAAQRAGRDVVRVSDLGDAAGMPAGSVTGVTAVERRTGQGELDRAAVQAALAHAHGLISAAARDLGVHRTELLRLMEAYGILTEMR